EGDAPTGRTTNPCGPEASVPACHGPTNASSQIGQCNQERGTCSTLGLHRDRSQDFCATSGAYRGVVVRVRRRPWALPSLPGWADTVRGGGEDHVGIRRRTSCRSLRPRGGG